MIQKNLVLHRKNKKPIVWDVFTNTQKKDQPLVVFCHGYKGFKDWGSWDLVAKQFMAAQMCFVKFNFSHNGGTVDNPIDFPDLDAFAENNYSREVEDLGAILNYLVSDKFQYKSLLDSTNITVIGHSRGGGIAILKASKDKRIKTLITWASVSDFGKRTSTIGNLEQWKKEGVIYVLNGRTKQQMPHNYQFYEDYCDNKEHLNIQKATQKLTIPQLIIHGQNDDSVLFSEAENLHHWNKDSELFSIENANHVFNSKHPWDEETLPKQLGSVVQKSIDFIVNRCV